jgi:hypothetical protein
MTFRIVEYYLYLLPFHSPRARKDWEPLNDSTNAACLPGYMKRKFHSGPKAKQVLHTTIHTVLSSGKITWLSPTSLFTLTSQKAHTSHFLLQRELVTFSHIPAFTDVRNRKFSIKVYRLVIIKSWSEMKPSFKLVMFLQSACAKAQCCSPHLITAASN